VVVVDFGGGFAVAGAQDASGVLDEPALEGDGGGEEQGVEGGAVEAFPRVRPGRDGLEGSRFLELLGARMCCRAQLTGPRPQLKQRV
jgi:hypothetical protein